MASDLPPSGIFIQSVRDSSRSLRLAAGISIRPESIHRLLLSPAFTDSYKRVSTIHGLAMPLNFPSVLAELNLLSILSLLNFASGYRLPLHVETGRGAWDSIRAFVFSLYLTSSVGEGDLLSAKGMCAIGDAKVAELMRVNIHIERPHESLPFVTVGELGGPLYELVKLITGILNETGEILDNLGYPDLGSFVLEALKEASTEGNADAEAEVVLERLVRAIPGFRDFSAVNGEPIYCFKKALFLIHAVVIRFGSISPPPFPIPSTSHFPVFSDNVIPSLLIHLGVIDLSASPSLSSLFPQAGAEESLASLLGKPPPQSEEAKLLPKEGPVVTSGQAYILRAAAIDACELIVETARSLDVPDIDWLKEIRPTALDFFLWSIAKDRPDYRKLERFVLRNTVFF